MLSPDVILEVVFTFFFDVGEDIVVLLAQLVVIVLLELGPSALLFFLAYTLNIHVSFTIIIQNHLLTLLVC